MLNLNLKSSQDGIAHIRFCVMFTQEFITEYNWTGNEVINTNDVSLSQITAIVAFMIPGKNAFSYNYFYV